MSNARNLAAFLRGGAQPRDVALAVILGLLAGAVTGWNLTLAGLLLLVVLLNVHTRTFLASWAASLAGTWLLGRYTYRLGHLLLDSTPLGDCIAALGDGPLVALLDWDRYTLIGGAAAAAALSLPASRLAARLARRRCEREPSEGHWLRRWGMVGAAGILVVTGVTSTRLVSTRVERELLSQLTEINGAPVTAGDFQFSLWTGSMYIGDMQLADPRRLDRDRLRIGRVTAQLHPGELVRGRLHADSLLLEHLRGDVARRQPAESSEFAPPVIDMPTFDEMGAAPSVEAVELDSYLRVWPALRDRLTACEPWVKALSNLTDCDEDATTTRHEHSSLGRQPPRVLVAKLRAAGLASSWGLGARATLTVTHLSSRPFGPGQFGRSGRFGGLEGATQIELNAPECATEISAEMNPRDDSKRITLSVHAHGLALEDLVDSQPLEGKIHIADGAVRLTGEGWIDANRLELSMRVEIDSLDARVIAPDTLGGISASVWDDGLRRLGALRTDVVLSGAWDSPSVTADGRRVVEQFKHQLRAAGEHRLVRAIEEQLARGETASVEGAATSDNTMVARKGERDEAIRIVEQRKTPAPRYPYPSTDDGPRATNQPPARDPAASHSSEAPPHHVDQGTQLNSGGEAKSPAQPGTDVSKHGEAASPPAQGIANESVTPAADTGAAATADPVMPADEPVAVEPRDPSTSQSNGTEEAPPATTEGQVHEQTPVVTAPEVEEPTNEPASERVVVEQPVGDTTPAAPSRPYGGATVRPARPSTRWRARAAAATAPAPAPRWTPDPEGDADNMGQSTADGLSEPSDVMDTSGHLTDRQGAHRDSRKRADWFEDEEQVSEKPEPREKLLARWSHSMRGKFGRMLPRRHDDIGQDEPSDVDRRGLGVPDVELPDDDAPIAEEASTGQRKPWFRIFRR
jgi:hypothetical protein